MSSPISHILRSASRKPSEPLNVLTFATHERYQSCMAATDHNFYLWQGPNFKTWDARFAPLPPNHIIMYGGEGEAQMPPDVSFDVILSQSKYQQYDVAKSLSAAHKIPLICLDHVLPNPEHPPGMLARLRTMRGDLNVFISEYSRDAWGFKDEGIVVEHGIDTEMFKPDPSTVRWHHIMAAVNKWIERDKECGFNFWKEVTEGLPCFVVGDTPGLSNPATSTDELVFRYQTSQIFINTALISPVPTVLLEAMACGCAVVSTENEMISTIIEDGVNGFVTNDKVRMRLILEQLLGDPTMCAQLGDNARQTIVDRFSLPRFAMDWDNVLRRGAEITNVGEW